MADDDQGWAKWDRERLNAIEKRLDNLERPMRDALGEIQRWQAGAIERETRREEGMKFIIQRLDTMQDGLNDRLTKIEASIPNKVITEMMMKALIGLGGTIIAAVFATWLGLIGLKKP